MTAEGEEKTLRPPIRHVLQEENKFKAIGHHAKLTPFFFTVPYYSVVEAKFSMFNYSVLII